MKTTGTPNRSANGFNILSYTNGATYAQVKAIVNKAMNAYENTLCNIRLIIISYPFC